MLFARCWTNRASLWHTLTFWVWLAGFLVSFGLSDLFHAPNCADQMVLQWAGHPSKPTLQSSTSVLKAETECAACAFQAASVAILGVLALVFGALAATIFWRTEFSSRLFWVCARPIARGPPLFPIS